MSNDDLRAKLQQILEAHGLDCVTQGEWLIPGGELPAIRAFWHPKDASGRLDIQVLIQEGLLVEECFAGVGTGDQALADALQNFMVNSLHVFLAALWDRRDPEQVTIEPWIVSGKAFTAYVGNVGTRASKNVEAELPGELFPAIEHAIKREQLPGRFHWIRIFFGSFNGEQTFEALLDNEPWERGVACLRLIPWQKKAGYYSARLFLLLQATQATHDEPDRHGAVQTGPVHINGS